jgi:LysM repeat protein
MNTPNPLVPQGSLPRAKSSLYIKVLTIVALHTALVGGFLISGCKDAAKDHVSTNPEEPATSATTAANTVSNTGPMSSEIPAPGIPAPITGAPAPTTPLQPVASTILPSPTVPVPAPVTQLPATASTAGAKEYTIVAGDILATIAKKNNVSLKSLEEANPGVDPKKLRVGNKLQIPASTATASTSSGASATPAVADASNSAPGDSSTYTVKSGDVLAKIAKSHGTSVKLIVALNDLKTTLIKPGEKLKLPVMKVASADTTTAPAVAPTPAPIVPTAAPVAPTMTKATVN